MEDLLISDRDIDALDGLLSTLRVESSDILSKASIVGCYEGCSSSCSGACTNSCSGSCQGTN